MKRRAGRPSRRAPGVNNAFLAFTAVLACCFGALPGEAQLQPTRVYHIQQLVRGFTLTERRNFLASAAADYQDGGLTFDGKPCCRQCWYDLTLASFPFRFVLFLTSHVVG